MHADPKRRYGKRSVDITGLEIEGALSRCVKEVRAEKKKGWPFSIPSTRTQKMWVGGGGGGGGGGKQTYGLGFERISKWKG